MDLFFIEKIKNWRLIYDTDHKFHRNPKARKNAFLSVLTELTESFPAETNKVQLNAKEHTGINKHFIKIKEKKNNKNVFQNYLYVNTTS